MQESGTETMKIKMLKYVKTGIARMLLAVAALSGLASCEDFYEYGADCVVTYRVKFRYDMNLKWADAFANEVKSVRLYAFDEGGTLVREFTEAGSRLADPDYSLTLDLPAGNYHLLAWCGIDNESLQSPQFRVPAATAGMTQLEALTCRLERRNDESWPSAYSSERLEFMFHGQLDVELPESTNGDYVYIVPLTKDTNHVRIILQQLSGQEMDVEKFRFTIEDDNGFYAHDNSLLEDETVTYRTYRTTSGTASVGKEDTRALIDVQGAIADLSVGRMMADHKKKMTLTITNTENGATVARVPLIDYALLAKDYYEEAYGHRMSDQEFLDREDEYVLTFFLDESMTWNAASILIHSWRIVLHNYGL